VTATLPDQTRKRLTRLQESITDDSEIIRESRSDTENTTNTHGSTRRDFAKVEINHVDAEWFTVET
jgi:hypothetical protein